MSRVVNRGTVNRGFVAMYRVSRVRRESQENLLVADFHCFVSQVFPAKPSELRFAFAHNVFEDITPYGQISLGFAFDVLIPDFLLIYSVE